MLNHSKCSVLLVVCKINILYTLTQVLRGRRLEELIFMTRLRWDKNSSGPGYRTIYIVEKPLEIKQKRKEPGFLYTPEEIEMYSPKTLKKKNNKSKVQQRNSPKEIKPSTENTLTKNKGDKQNFVSRTALKKSEKQRLGKLAGKILQKRLGNRFKNKAKNANIIQIVDS